MAKITKILGRYNSRFLNKINILHKKKENVNCDFKNYANDYRNFLK